MALLSSAVLAACTVPGTTQDPVPYRGQLQLLLEPNDAQGVCAVTVALRNDSGERQGDARLDLEWFDLSGKRVAEQGLRLDPTNVSQVTAGNLVVPGNCDQVGRVKVRKAKWVLGWDIRSTTIVPIEGADATVWSFRPDADTGLFVSQPVP